jgi:hypothetical protein
MRILLLILLLIGCTTPQDTGFVKFQAAIGTNEVCGEPAYILIDIEGKTHTISAKAIDIGVISDDLIELPYGWNEITRVEVFNEDGEMISKVVDDWDNELVVATVPFKVMVKEGTTPLGLQLFCTTPKN